MDNNVDMSGQMLKEFIRTFEASLDPRLWVTLIEEEKREVDEAVSTGDKGDILKEAMDLLYVTLGFNLVVAGAEQLDLFNEEEKEKLMGVVQEASVSYDKAVSILGEVDFYEAFSRVHFSNMSKLDEEGKPIKREDGKVLKGLNYKPAEMGDLV